MNSDIKFIDIFNHNNKKINYGKVCFFANIYNILFKISIILLLLLYCYSFSRWAFVSRYEDLSLFTFLVVYYIALMLLNFFIKLLNKSLNNLLFLVIYSIPHVMFKKITNLSQKPALVKYEDVFVDYSKILAFTRRSFCKESFNSLDNLFYSCTEHLGYLNLYNLLPKYFRNFCKKILIRIFLKKHKTNIVKFDNGRKNLLFINSHYVNYCHFLTEMMPKLYFLKDTINEYNIILKDDKQKMEYIKPILKAFGIKEDQIVYIEEYEILHFNSLCFVANSLFNKELLNKARLHVINFYKSDFKVNLGERLYFARKSTFRQIKNEKEVYNILSEYGFNVVEPEKYDIIQQMSIMQNAKIIFGINSTGIQGNMMFASKALRIIDARSSNAYLYPTCATNLLDIDLHYNILFCKKTNIFKKWHKSNILVDTDKLRQSLNKI